jgi:ubiquinone/menaquinone biosynthesis C-methylase UbiE
MNKKEFKSFFESYSKNVDNTGRNYFWKLSDTIILEIVKNNIPLTVGSDSIIMDAGGGTGKWICELSKIYKSKFILYDLSEDMLKQAKKNIRNANIIERVKVINGDLTKINEIKDSSVDYIISIYSPISFIYEKEKAIAELYRLLKTNGKIMIMGQGYYNALASKINNSVVSLKEIKKMEKEYTVKWNYQVPKLNIFSKELIEKELKKAGFKIKKTYGIPIFVQPGTEEFDPQNIKKSQIAKDLESPAFFETIFDLEMKYNNKPEAVNRGMNIFSVAEK